MFIIPENKSWVIYGIRLDKENSKYRYIGKSSGFLKARVRTHKSDAVKAMTPFYKWVRSHNSESFLVEVIDISAKKTKENLNELEVFWIEFYRLDQGSLSTQKTNEFLFNVSVGGDRGTTDDETKKKISESVTKYFTTERREEWSKRSKEQWSDPEMRAKITGENNHMYGKRGELCHNYGIKRSKEYKKASSELRKGKPLIRPKASCPHCGKYGDISHMKRFHFDNCPVVKPREVFTCPHCGKTGGELVMKRWHFNNCRLSTPTASVSE